MQELAARSGLSRTKIHHYLREELLPPVRKSARNAALYGTEHLERLNLIAALRDSSADDLSIPQVRTVLAYMAAGMSRVSAVRLAAEGVEPTVGESTAAGWATAKTLATAAGVTPELVHALQQARLIPGAGEGTFSAGDLLVARACGSLCGPLGVDPADLTPLFDLIREVGDYSDSVAELYSSQAEAGSTDSAGMRSPLRDGIRDFLDVLLWRALES